MMELDVLIIGAGAAGLMCAVEAGRRGRRVRVIDHAKKPAEKIRISGGGRCNFTNLHTRPANFLSQNPSFCASALARYTPHDFIAMVKRHGIAFHEKTLGQLFCDSSSQQIIDMLLRECAEAGVSIQLSTPVTQVRREGERFHLLTPAGSFSGASLVVASGGLSIPKMGASGIGYDIARQFGLDLVPTRPALVPFTLTAEELAYVAPLSGIAVDAIARIGTRQFHEGLLFTHRGISGPSVLQISSYWQEGDAVTFDLLPGRSLDALLTQAKAEHPHQELRTVLSHYLPKRVAAAFLDRYRPEDASRKMTQVGNKALAGLAGSIQPWRIVPGGTEGYRTAEVTCGGVDTRALSSRSMECAAVPGLFFIGEVVDVTGHLGGFNFQWAWSSGHAAGQYC